MKKVINLLLILVLSIFICTTNVYAEEIPEIGVRYVVTSASGERYVSFDLEDAQEHVTEELIFDGRTDSNGEIAIEGISNEAEIRIVDVSTNKEYRKTVGSESLQIVREVPDNPKTNSSIMKIIALILAVSLLSYLTIKKRKLLPPLILLIVISVLGFINVHAETETIKLVDSTGKVLKNQPIKIYANKVLSYEEVKIIINYDLSKIERHNGGLVNSQYVTFIDGSDKKQVIIKWDYNNNEWSSNQNDVDLRYLYAIWKNNKWIQTNFCQNDEYDIEYEYTGVAYNPYNRQSLGYYFSFSDNSLTYSSIESTPTIEISIDVSDVFQPNDYTLPDSYQNLIEDANYTLYPYNDNLISTCFK